jgi:methyl-accepting chemotaxis protein
MKLKNIKIGTKLSMTFGIIAFITLIVGLIGYYQIKTLADHMGNVGNNRIPDLTDYLHMNAERMKVRAQTLEVWIYENVPDSRNEFREIVRQRNESWHMIDKLYNSILSRPRQSERGRELMKQVESEYRAWRDQYVGMDKTMEQLANTINPEEKAALFTLYLNQYQKMVPVSNRLGATFEELATNNVNNTQTIVKNDIENAFRAEATMLSLTVIGFIIAILLAVILTRAIVIPVNKGVKFAKEIASGDLTTKLDVDQNDEIGQLGKALQEMVEKLREIINSVFIGADNIVAASMQMSTTSQQISQGATEQASSSEEVTSSIEEMASSIQQNTDNSLEAEKIAVKGSKGIEEGSKATNTAVDSMEQIVEKISFVNEIARQTNILALNAAVEAARAGEHGRGFAVVADEVRKLAERSRVAADEIDKISKNGMKVAENAGKILVELVPEIKRTAQLVQEISAASNEQNSGAAQINNAIQQLNTVTQQNAAASEELATASEELSAQALQLKEMIAYFKLDNQQRRAVKQQSYSQQAQERKTHVAHINQPTRKVSGNGNGKAPQFANSVKDSLDSGFEIQM